MESTFFRIVRAFESNGWQSKPVEGKPLHRVIFNPDGEKTLTQIGGEPFRHPKVTIDLCANKPLVKKILEMNGVQVSAGADFDRSEKEEARIYFELAPKPLVFKPSHDGGSHGVSVGVVSSTQFDAAWAKAAAAPVQKNRIQIERYIAGVEVRVYVVGNRVVGALARLQPFVVGDGESTIEELLGELEELRSVSVRLARTTVQPDWKFLSKFGFSKNSVVEKDRIVILSPSTVYRVGGLMGDITDILSPEIKELAIRAKNAIPHLEIAGIDFLVGDINDASTAVALEVNTSAAVEPHIYPAWGEARDMAKQFADYFHDDFVQRANAH